MCLNLSYIADYVNEALVNLTLPENANIYAKEYKLYLPDKKLLQKKLKEWLDEERKNDL